MKKHEYHNRTMIVFYFKKLWLAAFIYFLRSYTIMYDSETPMSWGIVS